MEKAIGAALAAYDKACMRLARTLGDALRYDKVVESSPGRFKLRPIAAGRGDVVAVWVDLYSLPEEFCVAITECPHRWSLPSLSSDRQLISAVWGAELANPLKAALAEPGPSRNKVKRARAQLLVTLKRHAAAAVQLQKLLAVRLAEGGATGSGSVQLLFTSGGPAELRIEDGGVSCVFGPSFAYAVNDRRLAEIAKRTQSLTSTEDHPPTPARRPADRTRGGAMRLVLRGVVVTVAIGLLAALSSFKAFVITTAIAVPLVAATGATLSLKRESDSVPG